MIGILFTQRTMESPEPPRVFTDFWTLAHAAMEIGGWQQRRGVILPRARG